MRAQPAGSHFIAGVSVAGTGAPHPSLYPATAAPIAELAWASDAEIESAVAAAREGVEIWRKTAPAERARVLRRPSCQPLSRGGASSGGGSGPEAFLRNLAGMSTAGQQVQAGMQPGGDPDSTAANVANTGPGSDTGDGNAEGERKQRARELMGEKLDRGELEDKEVEVETTGQSSPMVQVFGANPNMMEDMDLQMQNMLGDLLPKKSKRRRVTIEEARKILLEEELDRLVDQDKVQSEAIRRAEQMGIIFIDEIDKICGRQVGGGGSGPDVSREGVQRDLLPIV